MMAATDGQTQPWTVGVQRKESVRVGAERGHPIAAVESLRENERSTSGNAAMDS